MLYEFVQADELIDGITCRFPPHSIPALFPSNGELAIECQGSPSAPEKIFDIAEVLLWKFTARCPSDRLKRWNRYKQADFKLRHHKHRAVDGNW